MEVMLEPYRYFRGYVPDTDSSPTSLKLQMILFNTGRHNTSQ